MKIHGIALAGIATILLAGCTTIEDDTAAPRDTCQAEPGQRFIGQRATLETGAAIVEATNSTRLRWVPPRTAVTMEYAFGRVTVSYDDNYAITAVSCS